MKKFVLSFAIAAGAALLVFLPGSLVAIWHVIIWLVSAGLFLFLVEEYGDLDSGIVALAIFGLMVTGIALSLMSGLGWAYALALATPLLGSIGLLMARSDQSS